MVVSLQQSELAAGGEEANEIRNRVAVYRREDEALIPLTGDESSSFQVIKMMGQGGPWQFEKSLYLIYWQRLISLYETEENTQAIQMSKSFEGGDMLKARFRERPFGSTNRRAGINVTGNHNFKNMKLRNDVNH